MVKTCKNCGHDFKVKPSHYDKKTYCSRACMAQDYRSRMSGESNPHYSNASNRICLQCGIVFSSYNKSAKYCSIDCRSQSKSYRAAASDAAKRHHAAQVRPVVYAQTTLALPNHNLRRSVCLVCDKVIWAYVERKVCSKACRNKLCAKRRKGLCCVCRSEFIITGRRVTCSSACSQQYRSLKQSGSKSHRWKGGKTRHVVLLRTSARYKEWRRAVFARDDYTCQMCGNRGARLAAHHIREFSKCEDLRFVVANGITLCWPCHHSIKGKEAQHEARFFLATGGTAYLREVL